MVGAPTFLNCEVLTLVSGWPNEGWVASTFLNCEVLPQVSPTEGWGVSNRNQLRDINPIQPPLKAEGLSLSSYQLRGVNHIQHHCRLKVASTFINREIFTPFTSAEGWGCGINLSQLRGF